MLAITTGLRRSELLGLRWNGADLERGTLLRVGRSLVRTLGGMLRERPRPERSTSG